ncbi:cbb3-type cytochrome oxidase assembly protein CcoS [Parvibium lacunae]|uniref:Cbb3-type cytochrome oxidase assembly protein CcoS n=1 Tax=Parvibium lacunae TaxID=1888893 RepID=A0A368L7X8_9BURK|nr:cbb3-type cytochrome oxidase assembly protein CcoS [Parvibium lacunae]RCS59662.1 cbb3-type cytochrome oxidase assembly protein CcoS [Parvibium lacunae]
MTETLAILIPISLLIVGIAIWLFFKMTDSGQFDDLRGPAERVIQDDDRPSSH